MQSNYDKAAGNGWYLSILPHHLIAGRTNVTIRSPEAAS